MPPKPARPKTRDFQVRALRKARGVVEGALEGLDERGWLPDVARGWLPRAPGPLPTPVASEHPARDVLFVCGAPRSGTTVLARILGSHEAIVLGVERFRFLYASDQVRPDLFTRRRFFWLSKRDTNSLPAEAQTRDARLFARFESARYVGDKSPHIYRTIPQLRHWFPRAKFIFILRDPVDVAMSWSARAENPSDRWPAANDYRAAIPAWNEANRAVLGALGGDLLVVNYHRLISRETGELELRRMLDFLGLEGGESIRVAFAAALDASVEKAARRRAAPDHVLAYVREHAELETFRELVRVSGCGDDGLIRKS